MTENRHGICFYSPVEASDINQILIRKCETVIIINVKGTVR